MLYDRAGFLLQFFFLYRCLLIQLQLCTMLSLGIRLTPIPAEVVSHPDIWASFSSLVFSLPH